MSPKAFVPCCGASPLTPQDCLDPWACSCALPNGQEAMKSYPIVPKPLYEKCEPLPSPVIKPLVVKAAPLLSREEYDPFLIRDPLVISTSTSVYDRYVPQHTLHTPTPVYAETIPYETYPLALGLNSQSLYEKAMCYPSSECSIDTDNHWSGVAQYW